MEINIKLKKNCQYETNISMEIANVNIADLQERLDLQLRALPLPKMKYEIEESIFIVFKQLGLELTTPLYWKDIAFSNNSKISQITYCVIVKNTNYESIY